MLKNYLNTFDPRKIFILSILVLCVLGLLMVFSSSSVSGMEHHGDYLYFLKRQSFFLLVVMVDDLVVVMISFFFALLECLFATQQPFLNYQLEYPTTR